MIVDEIQTGMGRTGELFCSNEVKPDILLLGKALSGGMLPVSAILADNNIMEVITPGTHGSTFGGNPLGCSIAIESLNLLENENMIKNSKNMGEYLVKELRFICKNKTFIKNIRGKGLMIGVETVNKEITENIVNLLLDNNILCKSTRDTIIRLSPPLIIKKRDIDKFLDKFNKIINMI
jgi:ornithine--oxo-acid transaminase